MTEIIILRILVVLLAIAYFIMRYRYAQLAKSVNKLLDKLEPITGPLPR